MKRDPVNENPIGSAVSNFGTDRQTNKQTSCYFIIRIAKLGRKLECRGSKMGA